MDKQYDLRRRSKRISEMTTGYLLVLPVILILILLVFYPMCSSIWTSLTDKKLGVLSAKFVGLKNYQSALRSELFSKSLGNSILWTLASLVLQFILGMSAALLLNNRFRGRAVIRGLFIVPWVTPPVVVSIMYRWLLNGLFGYANQVFLALGLIPEPQGWFADPMLLMPTLIFINVWRGVPFMMITLLAGLQTIPVELHEAAKVDGAGPIRRFISVSLPFMRHVITISLLIYTLWNFNNFDMIYLLTRGGPGTMSFTLPVMIYSAAFEEFNYGKAAAVSTVMFALLLIVALVYLRLMSKEEEESDL